MSAYHVVPEVEVPQRCDQPENCPEGLSEEAHYASRTAAFEAIEEREPSTEASHEDVKELPPGFISDEGTALYPPGSYWFGDVSYVGAQDRPAWDAWVRLANEGSEGFTTPLAGALFYGYPLVGADTATGDGLYLGNDGLSYPVDGGSLGPVATELIDLMGLSRDRLTALGTWLELDAPTILSRDPQGTIQFGDLTIKTSEEI